MAKIESGNIKELWRVSYPMMVSFLSMGFMIFIDRFFLAMFSSEALNASVQSGTLAWSIVLGWMTMATMSEVFVAQYNGAKKTSLLGKPIWQMIWLVILSLLFYIPFVLFITPLIYNPVTKPYEYDFMNWILYFGPVFALVPAIGGFYIGQGDTKVMQWMAVIGNVVNLILDPLFIFGIDGYFPSMGVKGAAIATGIGSSVEALLLLYLFLRPNNRKLFETHKPTFDKELFFKSIKVGLPPSVFVCLEVLGWALFYHMMAWISPVHILVASVCQSILIPFFFFGMGIEKGAIALAGNFMGAGQKEKVKNVLVSGIKLIGLFVLAISICFILFPDLLINWFFTNAENREALAYTTGLDLDIIRQKIRFGLIFITFYIFTENVRWVVNGILTAAGDTLFLLIAGAVSLWTFLLLPTFFFIVLPKTDIIYSFVIWIAHSSLSLLIIFFRFYQGRWKTRALIEEKKTLLVEENKTELN